MLFDAIMHALGANRSKALGSGFKGWLLLKLRT